MYSTLFEMKSFMVSTIKTVFHSRKLIIEMYTVTETETIWTRAKLLYDMYKWIFVFDVVLAQRSIHNNTTSR